MPRCEPAAHSGELARFSQELATRSVAPRQRVQLTPTPTSRRRQGTRTMTRRSQRPFGPKRGVGYLPQPGERIALARWSVAPSYSFSNVIVDTKPAFSRPQIEIRAGLRERRPYTWRL